MQPSSIPEAHLLSGALLTEVPSLLIGQVSNDQLPSQFSGLRRILEHILIGLKHSSHASVGPSLNAENGFVS
jgi:hypothetical protein